jgi:phosphomevalonate kinase
MGDEASVPIEPETQRSLLEECKSVEGVLIAGVPGAGGYDAIFCIIADDGDGEGSTFQRLLGVWERRQPRVCPLLAREENGGILLEDAEALVR